MPRRPSVMPDGGLARWMYGQTDAEDAKHSCSPALCNLDNRKHGELETEYKAGDVDEYLDPGPCIGLAR